MINSYLHKIKQKDNLENSILRLYYECNEKTGHVGLSCTDRIWEFFFLMLVYKKALKTFETKLGINHTRTNIIRENLEVVKKRFIKDILFVTRGELSFDDV